MTHETIIFRRSVIFENGYYPAVYIRGLITIKDVEGMCMEGDIVYFKNKLYIFRNGRLKESNPKEHAEVISKLIDYNI